MALVREVQCGCEDMNKVALHSLCINVLSNQFSDVVLPCAGPTVQRKYQGLLWIIVGHESIHSFQDDACGNVLPKKFAVQVSLEALKVHSRE